MTIKSNLLKAGAVGAVATLLTAGAAWAAVATASVNVRSGPGTSYGVVDTLRPGQQVGVRGQSGGWCAVNQAGPDGWVSCAYLTGGGYAPRVNVYREAPDVNFGFSFGIPGGHVSVGSPPSRYRDHGRYDRPWRNDRPWWN